MRPVGAHARGCVRRAVLPAGLCACGAPVGSVALPSAEERRNCLAAAGTSNIPAAALCYEGVEQGSNNCARNA